MGKLKDIPFSEEADNIKDAVTSYWTKRTDGFDKLRRMELHSHKGEQWLKEIENTIPQLDSSVRILDVGCGSGFFEGLLGNRGYMITGIDLTGDMVDHAQKIIEEMHLDTNKVRVKQMDAEKLSFEKESFDVVISRNLTWTLPHPIDAYQEWFRVLKKGGILLNFDAEYAKDAHNPDMTHNPAHAGLERDLQEECHRIYHMLTISNLNRPEWDQEVLRSIGFHEIDIDLSVSQRIYADHDAFQIPDKMFRIKAVK